LVALAPHQARQRQNVANRKNGVELLHALLKQVRLREKKFLIQSRSFAEMLEASVRKYQKRAIEAAVFVAFVFFVVKDRDASTCLRSRLRRPRLRMTTAGSGRLGDPSLPVFAADDSGI
jgi:hypothetical protein